MNRFKDKVSIAFAPSPSLGVECKWVFLDVTWIRLRLRLGCLKAVGKAFECHLDGMSMNYVRLLAVWLRAAPTQS
jgi:hypothetical protein